MTTLNEKTKITLGTATAIFIFLAPLIVWAYRVESNSAKGAQAYNLYHKIDKRLDRIEIKLGTKPKVDDLAADDEED